MKRSRFVPIQTLLAAACGVCLALFLAVAQARRIPAVPRAEVPQAAAPAAGDKARARDLLAKLPLYFVENRGQ